MKYLSSKNIPKLIIILPLIGILVTSVLISAVTVYTIKSNFEKEKSKITKEFFENLKKTTKQRVELSYNIIDALYKDKKDYNQTIKIMQKVLEQMRWEKKGYIFVFDYYGNTIYHINKKYIGTNRWNIKRKGVKIVRLLISSALKHPEGTYVKYYAYNPGGSSKEKVSFVKIYKPLKIIIGSGVYLDYLDEKLLQKQKQYEKMLNRIIENIVAGTLISLIIMLAIVYYFASILKNLFNTYNNEIQREKAVLFKKANFDLLTGLYNREYFVVQLKEFLDIAQRKNKKLAVVFIDLDRFKEINDSLGHQSGDEVLKIIAKRLKKCVRKSDIVSRFGGDEFVILLYDIDIFEIVSILEKILNQIKQPVVIKGIKYYISASLGISISPNDGSDAEILIKNADTAMYKAKSAGKDRFEFYTKSMGEEANKRISLKNSLYQALEREEFRIFFQPQIDKTCKLFGMEVLIRWQHPVNGLISPAEFIPMAIEIGIIDKIDLWVIEHAMIQYKKWLQEGYNPGVISCNVTIFQLEKRDFSKDLKLLLEKHNFNPEFLNLEVTEESIMKNPEKSLRILNKIKELGVCVNIDDFGTGYSSLAYLKKFPVSKIKIDRMFIKDIPDDKEDMAITKTIINLAKSLNLRIIAEGVETEEQKEFVFSNGCDYIQGYYYSPPIDADEFEEKFLKKG